MCTVAVSLKERPIAVRCLALHPRARPLPTDCMLSSKSPPHACLKPLDPLQSPKKVLFKMSTSVVAKDAPAKASILQAINSPASPQADQPAQGLCASSVTSGLCGKEIGPLKILGGCATVKAQCTPPELAAAKCIMPVSMGAFVTGRAQPGGAAAQTAPRPSAPKVAQFEGCCVAPKQGATGSTWKKMRVGAQWRTSKTLTQNPLKQMGSCQCFNLREYVARDMLKRPNRKGPKHVLAAYPFTVGVASKVGAGARERQRAPCGSWGARARGVGCG